MTVENEVTYFDVSCSGNAIGETLQSIAEQYCKGDGPRQVVEFREGLGN
jgi:hypothetical protein